MKILIRDVTLRYGRTTALERLDLHVPEGAVYALLGRNGSGRGGTTPSGVWAPPTSGIASEAAGWSTSAGRAAREVAGGCCEPAAGAV